MSQYIQINDRLIDYQNSYREVVTGLLSKITVNNSPMIKTMHNQFYFREKISTRVKDEEMNASYLHMQSLNTNFVRLKQNLKTYARSSSFKVQKTFDREERDSFMSPNAVQTRRISVRPQREERVIFVDRKYNRELAIKAAAIAQIQQIRQKKEEYKKANSFHHVSPLAERVSRERLTYAKPTGRKTNPVLNTAMRPTLYKKRRQMKFKLNASKESPISILKTYKEQKKIQNQEGNESVFQLNF